jgi:hypothetical protein
MIMALLFALPVWAATSVDVQEVEKGSPTQVEDAYPLQYGEFDLEGLFRYTRFNGATAYIYEQRIEYGVAPNWQLRMSSPWVFGRGDKTENGNLNVELLRNLDTEGPLLPAVALSVETDFPTGGRFSGVDTTLKLLASKTLGKNTGQRQLHFNATWTHNAAPKKTDRHDAYGVILGYSHLLGSRLMAVGDFVRQQQLERGSTENLLELGVRFLLFQETVITLGGGYGIGHDSRDFHVQSGLEVSWH